MINHVILVGNLTREPETNSGPNTTMTRLRLATNSVWRDGEGTRQEATEYHCVLLFGRAAETYGGLLHRGKRVYVQGRLRTREYAAADGTSRHSTEIVAELLRILDRAPHTGGPGGASPSDEGDPEVAGAEPVAM